MNLLYYVNEKAWIFRELQLKKVLVNVEKIYFVHYGPLILESFGRKSQFYLFATSAKKVVDTVNPRMIRIFPGPNLNKLETVEQGKSSTFDRWLASIISLEPILIFKN